MGSEMPSDRRDHVERRALNETELPYVIGRLDARLSEVQERLDRQARWQEARELRSDELFDRQETRHSEVMSRQESRHRETIDRLEAKITAEAKITRELIGPLITQHQHMNIGAKILRWLGWAILGLVLFITKGDLSALRSIFGGGP